MKVVVAGIEYVFETGSEPSTAVVVNMNTTMAVSMGVGLVSDYDMERVVEIVAIVERASENLLSAEACLRIDFAKINCDDPERVRVLRATNRGSWIVPLVSRKVVSREVVYENFRPKMGNSNCSEPQDILDIRMRPHEELISQKRPCWKVKCSR
ncbi:hypothetical protein PC123_g23117 [Phytophthora cactorum]|nr:hypothetical protein PC123_g23117 [Phytophthora cactorum]